MYNIYILGRCGVYIHTHTHTHPILVNNVNNGGGYACVGAESI